MNCLSCEAPVRAGEAKFFLKKILLCKGCNAFAEKEERELKAASERALQQSLLWLEQRVMRGEMACGRNGGHQTAVTAKEKNDE